MKFLIASDIHGSAYWCRKVLEKADALQADRLILLGDLLYHGPRNPLPDEYSPKEVSAMLNARADRILAVRGNCDAEVDQMVLTFPMMADYAVMPVGNRLLFITHGHLFHNDHLPALRPGDILLHGHTHVSVLEEHDTHIYMNPGSASLPKPNHPHGCMLLEDSVFTWYDLEGGAIRSFTAE